MWLLKSSQSLGERQPSVTVWNEKELEYLLNGLLWAPQVWSESGHLGCGHHHLHPPVWVPPISKVCSLRPHPAELLSQPDERAAGLMSDSPV